MQLIDQLVYKNKISLSICYMNINVYFIPFPYVQLIIALNTHMNGFVSYLPHSRCDWMLTAD